MLFYYIMKDNELVLWFEIDVLKSENKGLKVKIVVLEENIDFYK